MKNNDKHNHHYSSRFYLKYWANSENKVWVYELNQAPENLRPNPGLLHVDSVCSDYHLFSIGEDHNKIEDWSDKYFETPSVKTFEKLHARENVDEDDIVKIKAFLALTIARNPVLQESSQEIARVLPHRNEIVNPLAQTIPLRIKANLDKLGEHNLQILCIPDKINASFITSDIPFVILWNTTKEKVFREDEIKQIYRDLKSAGDTRTKDEIFGDNELPHITIDRIWFPISPKTVAFLSNEKPSSFYEEINDIAHISNINAGILRFAKDILIMNDSSVFNSLPKFQKIIVKE